MEESEVGSGEAEAISSHNIVDILNSDSNSMPTNEPEIRIVEPRIESYYFPSMGDITNRDYIVVTGTQAHESFRQAFEDTVIEKVKKTTKKVEIPPAAVAISVISEADKARMAELRKIMLNIKASLDTPGYRKLLEEYITLGLKDEVFNNPQCIYNKYISVSVTPTEDTRNYLSCRIVVNFYTDEKAMKNCNVSYTSLHVELRELFLNCSSIVVNKLSGTVLNSNYGVEYKSEDINKLTSCFIKLLEDVCDIAGYSNALYSVSYNETQQSVREYFENNWKCVDEFVNKRTKNTIKYFTKKF